MGMALDDVRGLTYEGIDEPINIQNALKTQSISRRRYFPANPSNSRGMLPTQ